MDDRSSTNPPSAVNRTSDRNSEPYMGGADAVQKTTSLGDAHGTDATGSASSGGVTAPVASRGGLGVLGWGVLVVAALLLVAYAAGLFT